MEQSTTIIKNYDGDRIMNLKLSNHDYYVFTIFRSVLIAVERYENGGIILLCNRKYHNAKSLNEGFNNMILMACTANNADDFLSNVDTYIDLNDTHNTTTDEIISVLNILINE